MSIASAVARMVGIRSEFRRVADRVVELRDGAPSGRGIVAALHPNKYKVNPDDYLIMGCDNSSAARNHPDVPRAQLTDHHWFAARDFPMDAVSFGNAEGTGDHYDSFYSDLVRPEYRASPEEVAWHYLRVKALRAADMPRPERIATLKAESATKPWEQMQ